MQRVGLGGGCHWCTEAVFQSLKGVHKVEQGWIATETNHQDFSEAVIVHFNDNEIGLSDLINIHLHTHSCTSDHSMRQKYRSAVYCFCRAQQDAAECIIQELQRNFPLPVITKVLRFAAFKVNQTRYHNYYYADPGRPFCKTYIQPKMGILKLAFREYLADKPGGAKLPGE